MKHRKIQLMANSKKGLLLVFKREFYNNKYILKNHELKKNDEDDENFHCFLILTVNLLINSCLMWPQTQFRNLSNLANVCRFCRKCKFLRYFAMLRVSNAKMKTNLIEILNCTFQQICRFKE